MDSIRTDLNTKRGMVNRRTAIFGAIASSTLPFLLSQSSVAEEKQIEVYFGCGCFWHVQHEFIEAERRILRRKDEDLTSLTGYAGGTKIAKDPRQPGAALVCYHNFQGIADYGKLGHGEVVGMRIPESKLGLFAKEYVNLLDSNGDRSDKLDRGPDYRSLLGLPGGISSPLFSEIKDAADAKKINLVAGKGNDADTLGKRLIWVMDSDKFPFYPGEIYHQFHDDMIENYPASYNDLRKNFFKNGMIKPTGCPDMVNSNTGSMTIS